jgi:glycerophosphoryl diester phosphodiesterase
MMNYPVLEHPGPKAFAHRGGASEAPENTLPAFQHAADLGYVYLETDVHLTADGVLMAFHDDQLDRTTDAVGAIADLPYSELASVRVDGREPIPRFADLLEAFPHARFNVDPKADDSVEPLAALLLARRDVNRVCIGAFSDERITRMQTLCGPELCTSSGPKAFSRFLARSKGGVPPRNAPHPVFQVPLAHKGIRIVTPRLVRNAHRAGAEVHVWTIDEPAVMHELLDMGVDGVMTDKPILLKSVLQERGEWFGTD